jgi:hypothetical protein
MQFSYLSKLVGAVHCLPIIVWAPAVEKYPEGRVEAGWGCPSRVSQSQLATLLSEALTLLPKDSHD